jgi:hypothetical protein
MVAVFAVRGRRPVRLRTPYTLPTTLGTLAFYLLAAFASPFVGAVGIVIGLYGAWAIRRGGGQLWGYLSAGLGVALGLAQFAFLFRVDSEREGFTITAATNVTAT